MSDLWNSAIPDNRTSVSYMTKNDLIVFEKKQKEWMADSLNTFLRRLEVSINEEIARVVKDQDERCIIELCKIIDEKLEEFREELYEDTDE